MNAAAPEGECVNAPSGLVDAEGERPVTAPDAGEQYFVCEVALEEEAAPA